LVSIVGVLVLVLVTHYYCTVLVLVPGTTIKFLELHTN